MSRISLSWVSALISKTRKKLKCNNKYKLFELLKQANIHQNKTYNFKYADINVYYIYIKHTLTKQTNNAL